MTGADRIADELQLLSGTLNRLHAAFETGETIDLAPIESRVGSLCAGVAALGPAEGGKLRPRLLSLLDDFDSLTRVLEAGLEDLKQQLGDASERRQAVSAYGKPPGPQR
jgi:hypothetical protein